MIYEALEDPEMYTTYKRSRMLFECTKQAHKSIMKNDEVGLCKKAFCLNEVFTAE